MRTLVSALTAILTVMVLAGCGGSTPTQRTITLTLVRSAESESNAAGVINTSAPGPSLSPAGELQAAALANRLKGNQYDGVYASALARGQQSAAPMAKALGKQVVTLPGLDEISAIWFDGFPATKSDATFMVAPMGWLNGDRNFTIPGSINGNEFNGQFTGAVQRIYQSGNNKPIAFSSGASIMLWTLMNARNPKNSLITDHPLPNTGRVVLTGNPVIGWTIVDWDGITEF